jgi:ubiquinone biosynthesis protein
VEDPGRVPPADRDVGAFSADPPWLVEPDALAWMRGLHDVRAAARAAVPRLVARDAVPPIGRVARVVASVGTAVALWYVRERGTPSSRRALSARLRRSFERLGSTYVKLGQIVSGGAGLFPEELVGEFKLLLDRVPPERFEDIRAVVEADLGRSIHQVFDRFDPVPVAAASIAQVHGARLRTGEEVVVKVQRPGVARLVHQDVKALSWLAPLLVGRIPVAALANPPALVELFAETISEELDFRLEAENMIDVARVLAETAGEGPRATIVPRPHPDLVTPRVLVMERLDGFAWDDVTGMRGVGVDTEAVLHTGLVSFMEGAMLFGVFHGDLHGGNLLVRPDGTTVLLDFGITGRLDERKRMAFLWLLVGATNGDVRSQLRALRDLGAFPADTDLDAVFTDLNLDQPVDPTTLSADQLVHELQELTKKLLAYGARAPKELMLFVKNMMFLDGAIATLAPELDILAEIEQVHTEITLRHGEQLARELGIEVTTASFDVESVKAALGVGTDVERLTYRDVQARRDTIRRRMEERRRRV